MYKLNRLSLKICLMLMVLILAFGPSIPAHGEGGDIIWQFSDTQAGSKQESHAMAVDSSGYTVIAGFSDQSGSMDYYTLRIQPGGSMAAGWPKSYDMSGGTDHAEAVAVDSSDNVIVTGYAWNASGNYDFHTIKYDSGGNVLWEKTFDAGVNGNDYAEVVAVGISGSDLDDVYIGGYSQNASGDDDFILIRYPAGGGDPVWQKTYNGPSGGNDRIFSIAATAGGIAVTGESQNVSLDFDSVTIKYDIDGTETWGAGNEARYNGSGNGDDEGVAVRMDSAGNVIAAVSVTGTNHDIYTVKYNSATGSTETGWEDTGCPAACTDDTYYDGGYNDDPADLWIDSSDNVYITGYSFSADNANGFYTAKYDSSGTLQWDDVFNTSGDNNDRAAGIVVDDAGDVFVTGDTFDISGGNYDFQTLKYTKNSGHLLWQKSFNGTADKNDRVRGIALSPPNPALGDVIVGGWSEAATTDDYDFYAIKYKPGLLNDPTDLTATAVSTSRIDLLWTVNSTTEDGFKIDRKKGDSGTWDIDYYVGTTTGQNTYSDTGLDNDTKYYYRVRAYISGTPDTNSNYSNEAYAVTTIQTYTSEAWKYTFDNLVNNEDKVAAAAAGPDYDPVVTGHSYSGSGTFDYYTVKLNRQTGAEMWNARYDGDQNDLDMATTLCVDDNNDVLVSGWSYLYSIGAGENTNEIYSLRYPSTGPPEDWVDQYGGPGDADDRSSVVDVSSDGLNNYVVVGYGRNAIGDDDIYVIEYDPDGNIEWAATPYDGGGNDYPRAVAFDPAGDIIVAGYSYDTTSSDYDYFTRKYSRIDGAEMWIDVYDSDNGNDYAVALDIGVTARDSGTATGGSDTAVTDSTKSWAVSGWTDYYVYMEDGVNAGAARKISSNTSDTLTFEAFDSAVSIGDSYKIVTIDVYVTGSRVNASGNEDFFTVKYNGSDGSIPAGWPQTFNGPADGIDEAVAVKIDPVNNEVVVTGSIFTLNGENDFHTIRYDSDGNVAWQRTLDRPDNDDFAVTMGMDLSGNVHIAGDTYQGSSPTSVWDVLTVRYDHLGSFMDGTIYNGTADETDSATAVTVNGLGEAFIGGYELNSSFDADYLVFKVDGDILQVPIPFVATVHYKKVDLVWADNSEDNTSYELQRKDGVCASDKGIATDGSTITVEDTGKSWTGNQWLNAYVVMTSGVNAGESRLITGNDADTLTVNAFSKAVNAGDFYRIVENYTTWTTVNDADVTSYTDDNSGAGLSDNTSYCYRIRTKKSGVPDEFSRWVERDITTVPLPGPANLTATALHSTEIYLTWDDTTTSEDKFNIERKCAAGPNCAVPDTYTEIYEPSADDESYTDTTVCEGTTYTYRINAEKTAVPAWTTGWSNEDSAATDDINQPGFTPSGLAATEVSEIQIDLEWTDNTYDETGFKIERCLTSSCVYSQVGTTSTDSSIVMLLNMDEGSWDGTTGEAADSSVPGTNDGTAYNGATTDSGGKYGFAGSFDGNDDYIDVPNSSGLNILDDLTLELWFKPDITYDSSLSDYVVLLDRQWSAGTDSYFLGINSDGKLHMGSNGGSIQSTQTSWTAGTWYHVVVTYRDVSGSYSGEMYINGTPETLSVDSYDNMAGGPRNLGIGGSDRYANFDGIIDRAAVYNRSLTSTEANDRFIDKVRFSDTSVPDVSQNYTYRVTAYKTASGCSGGEWNSEYSSTASANSTITSPSDLTATALSSTAVFLTWTDNTASEEKFNIERCEGDYTACASGSFTEVGEANADAELYTDSTACAGTTYTYRVNAEDTTPAWTSGWSTLTANSDATTDSAGAPSGFTDLTATESQIEFEWTDNSNDESGFRIERCVGGLTACDPGSGGSFTPDASLGTVTVPTVPADNVMLLQMDEASWSGMDNEIVDSSGSGNHGRAYNNVDTDPGGMINRAGSFSNTQQHYLKVPDSTTLEGSGDFTIEMWVKPYNTGTWEGLAAKGSYRYLFALNRINSSNYRLGYYGSGWVYADTTIPYGQWRHVAVVYDGTNSVTFYVNGQPDGTRTISANQTASGQDVLIGQWNNNYWYKGLMDEVAIYDRALTDDEILERYKQTSATRDYLDDTGLLPSTTYTYRIWSYKTAASCAGGEWESGYDTYVEVSTTAPEAPTNLDASTVNTTEISLVWEDNTTSETGFEIERCYSRLSEPENCDEDTEFAYLDTVGSDVTTYTDITVCEYNKDGSEKGYYYQVKAVNTNPEWDETGYSNIDSAETDNYTAPSSLTATTVTEEQIDLMWIDNTNDETSFKIERCPGDATTCASGPFTEVGTLGSTYGDLLVYHMDEASWGTVIDSSEGGNNNGTAYGDADTVSGGKFGRAGNFDGNGDYVGTALNIDQSSSSQGVTMAAWVKPASTSSDWHHVISTYYNSYEWSLARYGSTWRILTGSTNIDTGFTVDVDEWQHIAAVYTPGTGITFYKNGAAYSTSSIAYNTDDRNVIIGRRANTTSWYFDGLIDEVALYNNPLSFDELYQLSSDEWKQDTGGMEDGDTTWIQDADRNWAVDEWADYYVVLTSGPISGESRKILSNTSDTITVEPFSDFPGGQYIVQHNGTKYTCILSHTSSADNEPGVGASWTTYWTDDGAAGTEPAWGLSSLYSAAPGDTYEIVTYLKGTATGGSTTTVADTDKNWTTDEWTNYYVVMETGNNKGQIRKIISNTSDTLTIVSGDPFGSAVASGNSYKILPYLQGAQSYGTQDSGDATDGSTLTVVDTSKSWTTDEWTGYYVLMETGSNAGEIRQITDSNSTTLTVGTAFSNDVTAGDTYRIVTSQSYTKRFSDTGLTIGQTYSYRVRGYKDAACLWPVEYSNIDDATIAPPAPTNLTATKAGTTQIDLEWTDNTETETGFKIFRCIEPCTLDYVDDVDGWDFLVEVAGTSGTGIRTYPDSSVTPGVCESTTYRYSVAATSSSPSWDSDPSNEDTALTDTATAPDGFTATQVSETQIALSWNDNTVDETGFKILRCIDPCTPADPGDLLTTLAPNFEGFSDTGLAAGTTYNYEVHAYKTTTCPWDKSASASESTSALTAPVLNAAAVNTTRIDLDWTDNTTSETGFEIYRCEGAGCDPDAGAPITTAGPDVTEYTDNDLCNSNIYTYQVNAVNEGLSNSGGGCWARRALLTITDFQLNYQTMVTIDYTNYTGMQADFDDIRFYDETAGQELPYFIEGISGNTATVYFRTLTNNNIYMYYDNGSALSSSSADRVFEFYDDFQGTVIDTAKWEEDDPGNWFYQNDDLILNDVNNSDSWNRALVTQQTFSRDVGREVYVDLTIGGNTSGNNYFMAGWEKEFYTSPSYNQLVHGLYWNNGSSLLAYEYGSNKGGSGSYSWNTDYEMRIVLMAEGAKYYVRGGAYSDWTLVQDTSDIPTLRSDATMRLAFTQNSHQANIHVIRVQNYAPADPGVATGSEETAIPGPCYSFGSTWSVASNEASDTTLTPAAPSNLAATTVTDTQIDLSWTDNTDDETGFRIERCIGSGCTPAPPEIATVQGYDPSLAMLLRMDESSWHGAGGEVADSSGNGNNGTAYTGANTTAAGKFDRAGIFDGDNDYISISHSSTVNPTDAITVGLWAKSGQSTWNSSGSLASKRNAYIMYPVSGTKEIRFYVHTTGDWYYSSYTLTTENVNEWHHYAGTYDGTGIRLFMDGAEVGTPDMRTGGINPDTGPLYIGMDDGQSSYFKGSIDEVTIYDRALTDAEVLDLFNQGIPSNTKYSDSVSPSESYCYQVSAYKTASGCAGGEWNTAGSNIACLASSPETPVLTAGALNSLVIKLDWADVSNEFGYEIERKIWGGAFVKIATVGQNVDTYNDTVGLEPEKEYTYRIRSYNAEGYSGYSNEASATTKAWQEGDSTCLP